MIAYTARCVLLAAAILDMNSSTSSSILVQAAVSTLTENVTIENALEESTLVLNGTVSLTNDAPLVVGTDNMTMPMMNSSNNTFIEDIIPTSPAPSMAPTMAPTFWGGISPQCNESTAAMAQDQELSDALRELLDKNREEFAKKCPFTLTAKGSATCNVAFSGDNTTLYYRLCHGKGGQIFEHEVVLECGMKPLNVNYDLGFVPECIGIECNVTAANFDVSWISSDNITNFATSLDNGGCTGKVENSAAVAHLSSGKKLMAMMICGSVGSMLMSFF